MTHEDRPGLRAVAPDEEPPGPPRPPAYDLASVWLEDAEDAYRNGQHERAEACAAIATAWATLALTEPRT